MIRILILMTSFALLTPVFADNLTLKGTNSTATKIMIKLYSQDRKGHVWPSTTSHYPLTPGQTATFKMSCNKNEKICYGAKRENAHSYWGVGFEGKNKCTSCCTSCNNGTFTINLGNSKGT